MHRRAVIRQAIVAELKLNALSTPVHVGQVYPDTVPTLPAFNVVTGPEDVIESDGRMNQPISGMWLQTRSCEFSIECRAAGDALNDQLDELALEAEQVLGKDMTLGGECKKFEYFGAEGAEMSGDVEKPVGLLTMQYVAIYRVDARDPQALED